MNTQAQGFSPNITRYLSTLKGKQRQESLNQIAQLLPQDLEQLEMKLAAQYEQESVDSFDKEDYMALNNMSDEQYQMMRGGMIRKYQSGGINGDDSSDYLEQVYQQQLAAKQDQQPIISPTGVVMIDEMMSDLGVSQFTPKNGFRPNQTTYTPQQLASLQQQGLISTNQLSPYIAAPTQPVMTPPVIVESPVVIHEDPKQLNQQNKSVLKDADGVRKIQEELYNRNLLKGKKEDVIDGIFGAKTKAAVEAFQRQVGLVDKNGNPDGIVGAKTKVKLGLFDLGTQTYRSNVDKQAAKAKKLGIPVSGQSAIKEEFNVPYINGVNPNQNYLNPQYTNIQDKLPKIDYSQYPKEEFKFQGGKQRVDATNAIPKNILSSMKGMERTLQDPNYQEDYIYMTDDEVKQQLINTASSVIPAAALEGAFLKLAPLVNKLPGINKLGKGATELMTKYSDDLGKVFTNAKGKTKELYESYLSNPQTMDKINKMVQSGKETVQSAFQKVRDKIPTSQKKLDIYSDLTDVDNYSKLRNLLKDSSDELLENSKSQEEFIEKMFKIKPTNIDKNQYELFLKDRLSQSKRFKYNPLSSKYEIK